MSIPLLDDARSQNKFLFRPAELAPMMGVSRAFIYQLIEKGRIRVVRLNTAVRVPLDEVERILTEGIH